MRTLIFILLFTFFGLVSQGQVFVGKDKETVRQLMKEDREFVLDESSRNTVYNTLKYVDDRQTRTYLFLFDDNDTCTLSKLMCDYSFLNKITRQLNEQYIPGEEGHWTYTEEGKKYHITLNKGDWFFSVKTKAAE
jgi:hypothetical protein